MFAEAVRQTDQATQPGQLTRAPAPATCRVSWGEPETFYNLKPDQQQQGIHATGPGSYFMIKKQLFLKQFSQKYMLLTSWDMAVGNTLHS